MLLFILFVSILLKLSHTFQSAATISNYGYTFLPFDSSATPFLTSIQRTLLLCYRECNKYIECRTLDFDETSGQCQLWSEDSTTGSISLAVPPKPRSKVASIKLSPSTYAATHNQPCEKCVSSRYEICDTTTMLCKCPTMTFWNGSMCIPQRYQNQSCSTLDSCRSDRNLECIDTNCNSIYKCKNRTCEYAQTSIKLFQFSNTGSQCFQKIILDTTITSGSHFRCFSIDKVEMK